MQNTTTANKVIILGTAHGSNVPGKCSPDHKFREYKFSREVIAMLKPRLEADGFTVFVDMPGEEVPRPGNTELSLRCRYVNGICSKYGKENCVYVSIHVNAAGSDGKWHDARGFASMSHALAPLRANASPRPFATSQSVVACVATAPCRVSTTGKPISMCCATRLARPSSPRICSRTTAPTWSSFPRKRGKRLSPHSTSTLSNSISPNETLALARRNHNNACCGIARFVPEPKVRHGYHKRGRRCSSGWLKFHCDHFAVAMVEPPIPRHRLLRTHHAHCRPRS